MENQKLKRNLTFMNMVALAGGAVIGGWLAEAPYWFELSGVGTALLFPILALLLVPVGLAFGELTAMLPSSASVAVWTQHTFGHNVAWFTQWCMFLLQVVQSPMMAYILVTALRFFIPIPSGTERYIALAFIVIWYIISNFNVGLTGKMATVLFFCMIGISFLVTASFFFGGNWSVSNLMADGGLFPKGGRGIFLAMAVLSLKYIGFEMTPTMIEDTNFPRKRISSVVLSALILPAVLYMIVVLGMGGMAPNTAIAKMYMPEPEIISTFGMWKGLAYAAIISGMMHAFTTIMGFWSSSSRVIYGAASINQLPHSLMKTNKHGQPYVANLLVLLFSTFFIFFTDAGNWVQYLYSVSCAVAGAIYLLSCINAIILRKKHPDWERPYKAPGGTALFVVGIFVSIWIIIGSCLEMPIGGYISVGIYLLLGLVVYSMIKAYRKKHPGALEPITLMPSDFAQDFNE